MQEPKEIPFGEPFYTNQFTGPKRRKVQRNDFFYYVPLLDTLKTLLSVVEIQSEILNPHPANGNKLSDFCDGSIFKLHPLFGADPNALQIIGYYDELEVVNPIGSYVSKHKLGCLFFMLGNIRPRYRSTLKAINLVAVGKHEDICKYGMDTFMSPFVDDLKALFCDGIPVTIGSETRTFFGGLLAFLADNLAAHAVGGFKESMSFALRICRSCMITADQSQLCVMEDSCQLRCPETHFEQCQLLEGPLESHYSTNFGINRCSILEDVPGFSVVTSLPHDIMHDLFEGVVPYEMKCLISHCVQQKYFSVELLNDRIDCFDFVCDKPSFLQKQPIRIRQSASQMMALCLNFPLIIGDKVPEGDKNWASFLLLLRICSIAVSTTCTYDTIAYLRLLIEEKLTDFKQLYPEFRLIPKFHYMVHYPSQIEMFGPLIHSWTMRQESKLSFVKRASRCSNFKNVAKTVAKKHQLWQCYKVHSERPYLHTTFESSPKKDIYALQAETEHVSKEILTHFPTLNGDSMVEHPMWVKIHTSHYRKGVYLLLRYDPMSPEFGKVLDIVVVNDTVIFSLQVFSSEFFDTHFHAYVIKCTSAHVAMPLDVLPHYHPLYAKHTFVSTDKKLYITLPFYY